MFFFSSDMNINRSYSQRNLFPKHKQTCVHVWVLLLPANTWNSSFRILRFADGKLWITKTCLRAAAPGLAEWWRQGTMTLPTVPRHRAHLLAPQPMLHDSTDQREAARRERASERQVVHQRESLTAHAALPHTTRTKFQHACLYDLCPKICRYANTLHRI